MRTAGELDNLLDAGTNFRNVPDGADGHVHPDVIGGFDHFDTLFKIGNRYFAAVINIKNVKRGKLFKDVTKIKDVTQDIMSSYGKNPKSQFLRTSSMNSIRSESENVNKKFSQRDVTYMDAVDRGDIETAQKMVDETAKAAGYTLNLFHGTSKSFNTFEPTGSKTGARSAKMGIWLTDSANTAMAYSTPQGTDYAEQETWTQICQKADAVMEGVDFAFKRPGTVPIAEGSFSVSNNYFDMDTIGDYFKKYLPDEYEELFRLGAFKNTKTYIPLTYETYQSNIDVFRDMVERFEIMLEWYNDSQYSYGRIHPARFVDSIRNMLDAAVIRNITDGDEISPRVLNLKVRIPSYSVASGDFRADTEKVKWTRKAIKNGDDGIMFPNIIDGGRSSNHYVVFDRNNIKSADPITYDDNGNVIPLSERFNDKKSDIRYSFSDTKTDEHNRRPLEGSYTTDEVEMQASGFLCKHAKSIKKPSEFVNSDGFCYGGEGGI